MVNVTSDHCIEALQTSAPSLEHIDWSTYLIPVDHSTVLDMCLTDENKQLGHFTNCTSSLVTLQVLKPALRSVLVSRAYRDRNNNAGDDDNNDGKRDCSQSKEASSSSKKNVTFADCKGLALAVVIEVNEESEISLRFSDTTVTSIDSDDEGDAQPFVLSFKQPASNYLHFRDKLDKNFVSLENVILKDYTILGTIKVKNIAYDKDIFVRLTYDSWETFIDASACLATNISTSASHTQTYETFTFNFDIPSDTNIKKKIEFAVCYAVNGTQYWDNNDGENYQILSCKWQRRQEELKGLDSVSALRECESWTNFACWDNVDTSMPYW